MPSDLSRRQFLVAGLSAGLAAGLAVALLAGSGFGVLAAPNNLPLEAPSATALLKGDNDALHRMLLSGTDPNTRDTERQPLIVLAARNGLGAGVDLLLSNRARVDELDAFGNTALMWAADRGHTDIVRRLLGAGANPNLQNNQGTTALIRAAKEGQAQAVEALLEAGADVTRTDYTGRGALTWAQDGRSRRIIRVLEAAGARD